jgi:hypothetical protein
MLRAIAGILGGFLVGLLGLGATAYAGGSLYPIPVDPGIANPVQQAQAALPNAPVAALLFIALSWFVGGLLAGLVAKAISGSARVCWVTVGVLTLLCVINIFFAPFPVWMQIASLAAPLIGGLIANHLIRERATPAAVVAAEIPTED